MKKILIRLIILALVVLSGLLLYENSSLNIKLNCGAFRGEKIDPTPANKYEGDLSGNQKVYMTLSCDHMSLYLKGAVNQELRVKGTELANPDGLLSLSDEYIELTDLYRPEVKLESDYNSDGYNDISTVWSTGQGSGAITSYLIFLYNPATQKFDFNAKLSGIGNTTINSKDTN